MLYLVTLSVDAFRKLAGLPTATSGVVYVLTGVAYALVLPKVGHRARPIPRSLPVWLTLLSIWCAAEAVALRIPVTVALLGWVSYVYFVPLLYVGAGLMSDDRRAALALRIVAAAGGVIGLGAIVGALFGKYAPALLQPIDPSVAIHSFSAGNIYLAPSVFASAEEASEQLLVALFAWFALVQLRHPRPGRVPSAVLGALIAVGLFATARRADILVAVMGMAGLAVLGLAARRDDARGRRLQQAQSRAHAPRSGAGSIARLGPGFLLAAVGSLALLSLLGTGRLVSFLASGANSADAIRSMLSVGHPTALAGQGPGTSTQGASVVGASAYAGVTIQGSFTAYVLGGQTYLTAEGGLSKAWLELGLTGVAFYAGVFGAALLPLVRRMGRLDVTGRALVALAIALGVVFLKGHQSLDNPLVQPLFWLAVGGAWGRLRGTRTPRAPG